MIVLDSSMWLAFFMQTKNQPLVEDLFISDKTLLVPSICIYEVYKILSRNLDDQIAKSAVLFMQQYAVDISLDFHIALSAAQIHSNYRLAMANSVIYASALKNDCILWTQDSDFEGLDFVRYFKA